LLFPEDLEAAKLFAVDTLAEFKPFCFRARRNDGSPLWVNVQSSPVRTASGDVCGASQQSL
jgi:hypothetical protein